MDAATAAATPLGAWASIRGYFTPATLFVVLNIVIGTIALTSRSHQRRRREHHGYAHHQGQQRYQEPPPLDPDQQLHQQEYQYYQQQPYQYATPTPARIARTSSVLDRLRSIGLYRFRSGDFPPEYGAGAAAGANHQDAFVAPVEEETASQAAAQHARSRSEPAPAREEKRAPRPRMKKSGTEAIRNSQAVPAPAATRVVEAEEFVGGLSQDPSSPQKAEYHYQDEYVPPPAPMRAPPPLSRTSSVLDRLRSLGLYGFLGTTEQPAAAAATPEIGGFTAASAAEKKQAHAHYDRSRSEPAREQGKKEKKQAAEGRMAKSRSATRKAVPSLAEEEDCVDARAEAFIDSFRKEQSRKQLVHHHDENEHLVVPPPAPLARTSSVLDRLRSFSLYLRSSDPVPEDADEKKRAQYARSRSEPTREHEKKEEKKKQQEGTEEAAPAEDCVNARADDFINKFRQQLQLQRLNSLLNYKDMLNHGGSQQ